MDHVAGHDSVIVPAAQMDQHIAYRMAGRGHKAEDRVAIVEHAVVGADEFGLSSRNDRQHGVGE